MTHDLVVEGRAVLEGGVEVVQIGVEDGVVRDIRKTGLKGVRTIRAGRGVIFPGFFDSHVHLREPGWEEKEDFRTGTRAAAHGGVTTVLDMPNNPIPTDNLEALDQKRRLADMKAVVDVGFFAALDSRSSRNVGKLAAHCVGFKAYLAKSTGSLSTPFAQLEGSFRLVADAGRPLSLHCEDQEIIDAVEKESKGRRPSQAESRPPEAEIESIRKVMAAAAGVRGLRLNICHVSTKRGLREVEEARADGVEAYCEAALHHLFYSKDSAKENPLLTMNPPLREKADRDSLLAGVRSGSVDSVVTDHAPHTLEEKKEGVFAGVPGLDDYGHVVSWLVRRVGVTPERIAKVCAGNPASIFGFADRGTISTGKSADLAIIDFERPERVRADRLETKCGWSPYEGVEFPGSVRWTVRRGNVLVDDHEVL